MRGVLAGFAGFYLLLVLGVVSGVTLPHDRGTLAASFTSDAIEVQYACASRTAVVVAHDRRGFFRQQGSGNLTFRQEGSAASFSQRWEFNLNSGADQEVARLGIGVNPGEVWTATLDGHPEITTRFTVCGPPPGGATPTPAVPTMPPPKQGLG